MTQSGCQSPLDTGQLLGYWLGELDSAREAQIEEHLFACPACNTSLQKLVDLGAGVRQILRRGHATAVLTPTFIDTLKASGLRIREYHLEPQGSVACTIAPQDDLTIAHLHAPLSGVQRLDLVICDLDSQQQHRSNDVLFDAATGAVVLLPKAASLRQLGTATQRVQLLAIDANGERLIGEYTFNHSPTHHD